FNRNIIVGDQNDDVVSDDTDKPDAEAETTDTPSKRKPISKARLFPPNLHFETGTKRIDDIFKEIKTLDIKKKSNATAVLIRTYVDMVAYQFLKKCDGGAGMNELFSREGKKLATSNDKIVQSVKDYMIKIGLKANKIDD